MSLEGPGLENLPLCLIRLGLNTKTIGINNLFLEQNT